MSDNLFEQLFELFNQPGPVNWKLAEEIAGSLSGEADPVEVQRIERQDGSEGRHHGANSTRTSVTGRDTSIRLAVAPPGWA